MKISSELNCDNCPSAPQDIPHLPKALGSLSFRYNIIMLYLVSEQMAKTYALEVTIYKRGKFVNVCY